MKYTIQVPITFTLEVEADSVDQAIEQAQDIWSAGVIEMDQPYTADERWEDCAVYDDQGNYIEE